MATLAVVLLSGGVASATTLRASGGISPGSGHHGRHHHHDAPTGVFGAVASVNGTSTTGTCGVAATAGTFTLDAAHSTTDTVNLTTTTTFSEHGVSAPTFANVCVGEKAGAFGMISSGTVTATSVFVIPPPTPKPHAVFGTVASVNGTSTTGTCGVAATAGAFTLNGFHATTFTVDVSTTTTFSEHGVSAPTFANLCVGEEVGAFGMISSGTVTATSVFVTPPPTPKPHAVFGTVASVNGTTAAGTCGTADTAGTFILDAAHSTTDTVNVSTTTIFSEHGVSAPSFANLCVGEKAGAVGMISSGTVTATSVFVVPSPSTPSSPKPRGVFGGPKGSTPGGSPDVSKPTGHTSNNYGRFGSGTPTNGPQRFGHSPGHHSH
jgi:cyclophilin family peptidyl-prolyl cis-trans isomerase